MLVHTGSNWKRLSVAGALAYRWDGRRSRFFFHTCPGTYTDRALVPFIRALKRHFRGGRVVVIWDGLGGHTSRYMTAYLRRQRAWLTVERLPAYAPELNPLEQVWGNVKTVELANICAPDLASLRRRCAAALPASASGPPWPVPSCATRASASDMTSNVFRETH